LALAEHLVVAAPWQRNQQRERQPEVLPVEQAPVASQAGGNLYQCSRVGVKAEAQRSVLQGEMLHVSP
jgi:hypothetical protein